MFHSSKLKHADPSGKALPELYHIPTAQREAFARARALLTREEELCRKAGVLPPAYFGDPSDQEEFFRPDQLLPKVADDLEWGLLEDPHDSERSVPLSHLVAESIEETIKEMQNAFDYRRGPSARLRFRILSACWEELQRLLTELEAQLEQEAKAEVA